MTDFSQSLYKWNLDSAIFLQQLITYNKNFDMKNNGPQLSITLNLFSHYSKTFINK